MKPVVIMMACALIALVVRAESNRDKYTIGMTVDEVKEVMTKSPAPHTTIPAKPPKGMESLRSQLAFYVDVPGDGVRLIISANRTVLRIDDLDQSTSVRGAEDSPAGQGAQSGLHVKTEKENVVASRLIGKWKTYASLSERLRGNAVSEEAVEFSEDASVAAKVPERYSEFLKAKQVYLAGIMTRNEKTYPFILTEHNGNPYLFYFREKNGNPMGDGESFNLILAPAKEKEQDLLFMGGDFNNQPFSAFERVK
jgi:hypothetical protein